MSYLTTKQLKDRLNIKSSTTLWRWQQPTQRIYAEPLPSPVKTSAGSTSLWDEDQIKEWEHKHFRNNQSLAT